MAFRLPKLSNSGINYLKNATKSIAFIAADVAKNDLIPDIASFAETNKEFVKATYSTLRIPKMKDRRNMMGFMNTKVFQSINYGLNNLKQDLSTGDFYAKARQEEAAMEMTGFDMSDWDDLSEFGIDDDWEKELENPSPEQEVTKGDKAIVSSIEGTSAANARATVNAIIGANEQSIKNIRANTAMLFQQQEKIFGSMHNDLSAIGATLQTLFGFQSQVFQNIDKNLSAFQTELLKQTNEQTAILKDLLEIERNKYKSAQERELESSQKRSSKRKRIDDIYDVGEYIENVKGNIKDELSMFGIDIGGGGGGIGFSDMVKMVASAPVKEGLTFAMSALIPNAIKTASEALNESFSNIFANIVTKANKNKDDFGLLGFVSRIFGLKDSVNKKLDTSNYEKGAVPWDGIARKALTNVIPGYLARIEAFLTGRKIQDYDFENGRWQELSKGKLEFDRIKTDNYDSALYDLKQSGFEEAIRNRAPSDENERNKWDKAVKEFYRALPEIYKDYGGINVKRKNYKDYGIASGTALADYFAEIVDILDSYDKEEYVDSKGIRRTRYTKSSVKNALPKSFMQARTSQQAQIEAMQAISHGSPVKAFEYARGEIPEFTESIVDKLVGKMGGGQLSQDSINNLFEYRDSYGNTLHTYLYNINRELVYMRTNGLAPAAAGPSVGYNTTASGIITGQSRTMPRTGIDAIDLTDHAYLNIKELERQQREAAERLRQEQRTTQQTTRSERDIENEYKLGAFKRMMRGDLIDIRDFEYGEGEYALELSKLAARGQTKKLKEIYTDLNKSDSDYNEEALLNTLRKQFSEAGITSKELYDAAIERANSTGKKTYEVITEQERSFLNRIMRKLNIAREGGFLDRITAAPAQAFSNILYSADRAIYEMFFKYEFKDKDGNDYEGFLDFLTGETKNVFHKLEEKLLNPLKTKVETWLEEHGFGKEKRKEFKDRFVGALKGDLSSFGRLVAQGSKEAFIYPIARKLDAERFASGIRNTDDILYNSAIKKIGKDGTTITVNKDAAATLKDKRDTELKAMRSSDTLNSYLSSRGFGGSIEEKTKVLMGYASTEEEKTEILNRITRATGYLESEYNKQVQAIKDDPDMPIAEKKAKLAELARQYKSNQNDILNKIFARFDIKNHARGTVTGLPFTGNTMLTKGEVVINARGAKVVPKTGLYNIKDSHIINTEDAHDYLGVKGPKKSVQQALADEKDAERRIFNNADGTLDLGRLLNDNRVINKEVKVNKDQIAEMIKTAKESIPELAAGGLLGAVASGILGLVGGPLVGAAIGAGIGLTRKSETLKSILFGKIGEDGERENNGLIKTEIQDVVKKYAPGMAKYGAAGLIGSLITPLGPLGGILVGSAVGFLKQNDRVREKLFGKLDITEDDKDIVKRLIPGGIKGAAIGAIATMFGGPFGLVGNTIVGSAIGMASTTEEFKKLMLGERINGVLQGGILGPIKDAFAPIAEAGNEFKDRIFSTIDDNIIAPIQRFVKPTLNAIPRALGLIPRMIGKFIFNNKFGLGVSGLLQDFVAKPIIAALSPAAKLAGTAARIATTPFRLLGAVGNKIHKGQIDNRTDAYELASERVAFNTDVLGRKSSAYDLALAGIGSQDGMSVERAKNISQAITLYTTSRETLSRQKKGVQRQITNLLNKWRGSNGQSLPRRAKTACIKAIDSGATNKIANILKESGLSNEEFNGLWNQLKPLVDNWTELHTKEQEARNMSEADRSSMGKDLRAAFNTELGLKGAKLNFNDMDQLNNIAKQLNMEVEDRENLANLKAPELEIKENVTDIRDVIMQWASKGIKIQEGEDKDYQDKINDIINSHTAKENTSIRKALARGTKASEGAPEGSSEVVKQEVSRMTSFKGIPIIGALPYIRKVPIIGKYGKHIQFRSKVSKAIDDYGEKIGEDILNGIAEIGKLTDNNIEDLIEIYKVFKFDAESAKLIVSKTSRRISGLISISKNKYFKNYIRKRATNPKYATTEEIEYLLSISDSREFTRTLLRKLKLVSDCKAWEKFSSIKEIGTMSGDTEAALQSDRALGQSNYYNFFNDQETNQQIQEARENRPEHHGLGTALLGGLGSLGSGLLSGALGIGGSILGGIGGLASGLVKGVLGLGGTLLSGLFGDKNKNQSQAVDSNNTLDTSTAAQASQNIKTSTDVGQTALTGDTDIKGDGKETIYTNEGPMTLKRSNDNSLVPDTDQDTKATLNKKSLKEKMIQKVQAAQLASSKAITAALDAGKATAGAAKKGMGWLTKLLLGGMLLKGLLQSGVLKKLKDNILTPLWENSIKPKVTQFKDWVVNDVVPGIWTFAKDKVWPNVVTFFTEDIPNAFGWVKDKLEDVIPAIKDGVSNWWYGDGDENKGAKKQITDIADSIINNVKNGISAWWNGDGNENQGAKKQIADTIDNVKSGIGTWWYGDGGENKGALNGITNFISNNAGSFLTNTFFPALKDFTTDTLWPLFKTTIGSVARSLAGAIVKGIIPSAGQFLDGFVAEDNNIGATTTVDANKIVEEKGADYLTNMKDENGNRLTAQQINNHEYNAIYNEEGAKGEDTEDGNVVFTDRSPKGSEFAEAAVNAILHATTNPSAANLSLKVLEGISKGSTKLSGSLAKFTTRGLVGQTARLGIKGANLMVQAGTNVFKGVVKAGQFISNSVSYKTIAGKVDDCIGALLSHFAVLNKLKDTALGQGISNFAGWLKSLKESLVNVFHKATQEAVSGATDAQVKTATKAAGKALLVAQLVADFLVGCDQAESIIGVTETSLLEEIICGFINAIVNFTIIFALYPGVNTIASWLFEKIATDYEERKKEAQTEYEDYIKNHSGSTKTIEEYLRKKYSTSGFITESIKDAFGNLFKDEDIANLENSPSLALAYDDGNWGFTYNMTDADIAKKYSEMSQKEIRDLESYAMYDYVHGNGESLEFLKRLQYIKDTNPSLITNDAQGQYLWTSNMSDSDILNYVNNFKNSAIPEQFHLLENDYNAYGGLGSNGEIYERYLAIMNRIEQEENLKSQGALNSDLSNISFNRVNETTGLSSKNWPETYDMTDDQIRAAWSKYYSMSRIPEIKAGNGTAKEEEVYARYKLIQQNKSAKDFTSAGESIAHNAAGTISLSDIFKAKLPTDNELNNSTASIGADEDKVLEDNVTGIVRNSLTKLAGGIFGSVRTTMKDYATAIRSSIASFAQEDPAIRSVQDGNLSIFSKGYWNFGESSNTMGDILSDMAVGMGRTIAAPLLVVKSAMKSLTEDIKNMGPWMTTHFSELAGFFLHPMDYIYNEVLKNFLYAQSNNISGYVSPEGAVLSNIMNPYNANNIISTTTTKSGSTSSGTAFSTATSGSTTSTGTAGGESSTGDNLIDKAINTVRNIGSSVRNTVGNAINGVVNFFTGNKNEPEKEQSLIDKAITRVKTVRTNILDAGKSIGNKIISTGSKAMDFAGDVISNTSSFLSGLFGKGKYSKQIDPSIARLRYNARGDSEYQTIGDSACGPAAAVNVIESMYGRGTNPVLSASNYALSHGYKEQDGGTRPEFFTDYFNKFGLNSNITYDKSIVERNINAGIPTVLMGSDANGTSSSHPFGSNPHYVAVTGTDGRGHAIVQDPESRYDDQVYDIKDLVKRTSIGVSAYGRKRRYGRGISKSKAKSIINNITSSTIGNHNLPNRKQILSHYTNPKYGAGKFGRGRDVENQDLCVWADVTGEELDNFIRGYAGTDTPFYGNGALFVEIGESTGMDPVYILAHSACESGWGKSQYARERGNYFGIGAYDTNPDNAHTMATSNGDFHPDGLLAGVKWIKENYYDAGQTTLYLYNHAANGWHNYRTSPFDTEVGIMNSCYDSIPGYDSRQKKKHTGDGRSVAATSANTNNSSGSYVTTRDTRNMLLIKGIKYTKDLENGKTFSIGNTSTNTIPSVVTSSNTITMPSSNGYTYSNNTNYNSNTVSNTTPVNNYSSSESTPKKTNILTTIANGVKTVTSGAANLIHTAYENSKAQQEQQPQKKENLLTKVVNGVKKIFGKGHPYEDGRSVTKYGRGDEYQSVGQWVNRILTDNPTAQVVNSFMDVIGTKSQQEQQQQNNARQSTAPSSSTVISSAGDNNITGTGLAADVVRVAQHEAELTDGSNMENPNNSNSVKYNDWYYGQHVSGDAYPWCAAFVSWVLNKAGVSENILPKSALAKDFYDAVSTHVNASKSVPGDIVTFSRSGNPSDIYHVGIVENASGGKLNTIEGNTYQGSGNWGVYRVNYDLGDNRLLISHPNYGTGTKESKPISKYGRAKDFFRRRKPSYGMGNRASEVWNWFRTHGYSEAATAGILGNMEQESGVDPEVIQGNGAGPAAGIVQWENYNKQSDRWLNMSNYAQSKGRSWKDLESQLEFIDKENKDGSDVFWSMANTYKSYDAFKNADNITAATDSFEQAFERAGTPMMQNRYNAANKYYKQFTGKEGTPVMGEELYGNMSNLVNTVKSSDEYQSIGQWINNVLTNSPVAQVLNSFLDIGGSYSTDTEEQISDDGQNASSGGNYTGNSSLNSIPGAGGNSPLVTVTVLTGNNSGPRSHKIDTITIHYMAGDLSAETCGSWFAQPEAQASSNYGVDSNGVIGLYVDEGNRAWTSANSENDNRAVTIEVANKPDGSPTQDAYNALIDLCADICIRNGIPKLLWKNDPSLVGKIDQQNMTLHKWVSTMAGGTDCPGPWFSAHMGDIANDVNAKLSGSGRGKFGRGAGIKIDTSKLIPKGLGKDGKGIFGRGKTASSAIQSKLSLLRRSKTTLHTPANITSQITAIKPNTKKQHFAKSLSELTNGRGQEPAGRSKYGKGSNVISRYKKDIDYPIAKYTGLINNIASNPTTGDVLFEDNDYSANTNNNITPTDLFNDFVAGQAEEETVNRPARKVAYTARLDNNIETRMPDVSTPRRTIVYTGQQSRGGTVQSTSINYMGVIKEIVSILLKVANNTDKLNTIITILQDKLNISVSAKDVADAQATKSASSTARLANALMNANNRTTNLNAYADTINNDSINSIITAMNAIASE